jgi:hypothetical protein
MMNQSEQDNDKEQQKQRLITLFYRHCHAERWVNREESAESAVK